MDLLGFVARVNGVTNDLALDFINDFVIEKCVLGKEHPVPLDEAGELRLWLVTWMFVYFGTLVLYFLAAGSHYLLFFVLFKESYIPDYKPNYKEMWREIRFSVTSLVTMSAMVTPSEVLVHKGFTKLYENVDEYGLGYFLLSPILFLLFSDFIIYWVHRFLHHRLVYKYIHKPHHSFVHTTPFAAFAFHPLDGYMQGVAYHIFVYFIPFHTFMHLASLGIVGLWTINIHDRVDMGIPLINGAGHHRVHHLTFNHNYGQYFVIFDWLFGTMRDPKKWANLMESEESVYGDDAKKVD
uniref:Fatty acid hydroxylase domain-containing protein n=1 Tax=Rhodosorus marinus TaxID=101924 RepID=A0A7S0G942_9RHOD|mmetsp:Transcript_8026/g.11887  ORF Transcript_8026/g.11887 Transcript_8026/m.11887 type:complete len:295 (+) Transcript_8026:129-1013(+)